MPDKDNIIDELQRKIVIQRKIIALLTNKGADLRIASRLLKSLEDQLNELTSV
ncbi:MAG: hypothetical protein KDJ29_19210 [Hyphomicrobiales bacterium]|nr:hypothetical protein [Hyphomicrobiales bacterium]